MSKFKTNEEFFDFSKLLVVIPIEDLVRLLEKHEVRLPLYVHRFLLKETIRSEVFEHKLFETYTDEQKYRLRGYDNFSIYLLEKIIVDYNLDFDLAKYKEMLLNLLHLNKEALVIKSIFFAELEQLKHNYTVDIEVMKYSDFMRIAHSIFYEQPGFLDGIDIDDWTDDILASYTLGDLRAMGAKYEVKIPRRINKGKLVEILTAKFKLSADETELLETKSVLELEIYAKEKGFKISIDLKKTDMIEYIKFALGMYNNYPKADFFDYHIPLVSDEAQIEEDILEEIEEVEEYNIPEEIHDEIETETLQEPVEEILQDIDFTEPEEVTVEEPIKEEVEEELKMEETDDIEVPSELVKAPSLADSSLLSAEEKELLDEKINLIIKKYYKKRKTTRVIVIILIILVLAVGAWAAYTYLPFFNN